MAGIEGKKIVVTGSESFIGREVIRQAIEKGATIIGLDAVSKSETTTHEVDVRSPEIADVIAEGVDAVIHLAAMSRDADCRGNAHLCFDVNVLGTLNMIGTSHRKNVGQFIFASTEWVYDWFEEGQPRREGDAIDALALTSEYALSKLVSEANLRQLYNQNAMATTILRLGIIYGPRTENWAAVESLTHKVAFDDELTVGSLATGRAFVHLSDIAAGIIASVGQTGLQTINLQGRRLVTLGEIIETAKKVLGTNPRVIESNREAVSIRNVDASRAKQILGWEPIIDIEEGIRSLLPSLGIKHQSN